MILLDSDHVSILVDPRQALRSRLLSLFRCWIFCRIPTSFRQALRSRLLSLLDTVADDVRLPIVVVEEQLRGWLAAIHRVRDPHKQVVLYVRLTKLIDFVGSWSIVPWNDLSADIFEQLRACALGLRT